MMTIVSFLMALLLFWPSTFDTRHERERETERRKEKSILWMYGRDRGTGQLPLIVLSILVATFLSSFFSFWWWHTCLVCMCVYRTIEDTSTIISDLFLSSRQIEWIETGVFSIKPKFIYFISYFEKKSIEWDDWEMAVYRLVRRWSDAFFCVRSWIVHHAQFDKTWRLGRCTSPTNNISSSTNEPSTIIDRVGFDRCLSWWRRKYPMTNLIVIADQTVVGHFNRILSREKRKKT